MFLGLFIWLLVLHALVDGPMQYVARIGPAKRPGGDPDVPWQGALALHAGTHGVAVLFATGSPLLGLAEFIAHAAIDAAKGRRYIDTVTDQLLHVACKALWVWLLATGSF